PAFRSTGDAEQAQLHITDVPTAVPRQNNTTRMRGSLGWLMRFSNRNANLRPVAHAVHSNYDGLYSQAEAGVVDRHVGRIQAIRGHIRRSSAHWRYHRHS